MLKTIMPRPNVSSSIGRASGKWNNVFIHGGNMRYLAVPEAKLTDLITKKRYSIFNLDMSWLHITDRKGVSHAIEGYRFHFDRPYTKGELNRSHPFIVEWKDEEEAQQVYIRILIEVDPNLPRAPQLAEPIQACRAFEIDKIHVMKMANLANKRKADGKRKTTNQHSTSTKRRKASTNRRTSNN